MHCNLSNNHAYLLFLKKQSLMYATYKSFGYRAVADMNQLYCDKQDHWNFTNQYLNITSP